MNRDNPEEPKSTKATKWLESEVRLDKVDARDAAAFFAGRGKSGDPISAIAFLEGQSERSIVYETERRCKNRS